MTAVIGPSFMVVMVAERADLRRATTEAPEPHEAGRRGFELDVHVQSGRPPGRTAPLSPGRVDVACVDTDTDTGTAHPGSHGAGLRKKGRRFSDDAAHMNSAGGSHGEEPVSEEGETRRRTGGRQGDRAVSCRAGTTVLRETSNGQIDAGGREDKPRRRAMKRSASDGGAESGPAM
jgi:hypothetical protein